jgi:GNAT superfamily N-acetyltransferase
MMNDLYPHFRFTFSPDPQITGVFVLEAEIVFYPEDFEDDDVAKILEGEDAGKDFQVGTLSGLYVPSTHSLGDLFYAADAHSSEAASHAQALTQVLGDDGHLGCGLAEGCHSWIGVEMMKIDPRFRGRGLSYQFLDQLCTLTGHTTMITASADPIYEEEPTEADIAVATAKLKLHWLRFGFRELEDTGVYYINNALVPRPKTWLWEKQGYGDNAADEPNEAADEFDEGLSEGHAHLMPDGADFFNGDF